MIKILLLNKPYDVLSQFTDQSGRDTLAKCIPQDRYPHFYAAGRLDRDSEGLLILTDNGALQHQIAHPKNKLAKTYLVQVEGEISQDAITRLEQGVELKEGLTQPARAKKVSEPLIWPRTPPIRERKTIPTSWLELTIKEGKNRQVRRMTAAVGFPTLRLIRKKIGQWELDDLQPGEFKVLDADTTRLDLLAHTHKPKRYSHRGRNVKQPSQSYRQKRRLK